MTWGNITRLKCSGYVEWGIALLRTYLLDPFSSISFGMRILSGIFGINQKVLFEYCAYSDWSVSALQKSNNFTIAQRVKTIIRVGNEVLRWKIGWQGGNCAVVWKQHFELIEMKYRKKYQKDGNLSLTSFWIDSDDSSILTEVNHWNTRGYR